jgi:serine/threonine protein kinase
LNRAKFDRDMQAKAMRERARARAHPNAKKAAGGAGGATAGVEARGLAFSDNKLGATTLSQLAADELLAEAAILARLRHPNTVMFYGVAVEYRKADIGSSSHYYTDKGDDTSGKCDDSTVRGLEVSNYFFVTELCFSSLDKSTLGWNSTRDRSDCSHAAHLTSGDTDRELLPEAEGHCGGGNSALWEMLVQVAAGMAYLHSKGILHRDLKLVVMPAECIHFPHQGCMDFDFVWWRFSPSSCLAIVFAVFSHA